MFLGCPCLNAATRISVQEIAKRCNASIKIQNDGKCAHLQGRNFSILFSLDEYSYIFNGVRVFGQYATDRCASGLTICIEDWKNVLIPLISPSHVPTPKRICIDAGHGGKDSGACSHSLMEKKLTLDVAHRLRKLLLREGFEVLMTRKDDCFVPLEKRSQMANQWHADLFISIHFNSADSSSAHGVETYILPPFGASSSSRGTSSVFGSDTPYTHPLDERNLLLAYAIEKQLISIHGTRDRGVRRSRFSVLRNTNCPSLLIECGFITNPSEGKRIASDVHRHALAEAIFHGILQYISNEK
jgi:N-acetylmuramoyl-L-alanine amidase